MNIGSVFTRAHCHVAPEVTNEWIQERLNAGALRDIPDGKKSSEGFVPYGDPERREFQGFEHAKGEYTVFRFARLRKTVPAAAVKMRVNAEIAEAKAKLGRRPARDVIQEIKDRIAERMLDQAFPVPSSLPVVWNTRTGDMLIGTASVAALDDFFTRFEKAFQLYPRVQWHSRWAVRLIDEQKTKVNLRAWFETESAESLISARPLGNDFLTWLWYFAERENKGLELLEGGTASVRVVNKALLVNPIDRSERIVCSSPSGQLVEARKALQIGKVVESCGLWIGAKVEEEYTLGLDSGLMSWRSVQLPHALPDPEADEDALFLERMSHIETVRSVLDALYRKFLAERLSPNWDRSIRELMRSWFAQVGEDA